MNKVNKVNVDQSSNKKKDYLSEEDIIHEQVNYLKKGLIMSKDIPFFSFNPNDENDYEEKLSSYYMNKKEDKNVMLNDSDEDDDEEEENINEQLRKYQYDDEDIFYLLSLYVRNLKLKNVYVLASTSNITKNELNLHLGLIKKSKKVGYFIIPFNSKQSHWTGIIINKFPNLTYDVKFTNSLHSVVEKKDESDDNVDEVELFVKKKIEMKLFKKKKLCKFERIFDFLQCDSDSCGCILIFNILFYLSGKSLTQNLYFNDSDTMMVRKFDIQVSLSKSRKEKKFDFYKKQIEFSKNGSYGSFNYHTVLKQLSKKKEIPEEKKILIKNTIVNILSLNRATKNLVMEGFWCLKDQKKDLKIRCRNMRLCLYKASKRVNWRNRKLFGEIISSVLDKNMKKLKKEKDWKFCNFKKNVTFQNLLLIGKKVREYNKK